MFTEFLEDFIYEDETKDWAVVDDRKQYNNEGKEIARPDIWIFPQGKKHRDFAFIFECKCLNTSLKGKVYHGAAAYTGKDGIMCFVSGKYAEHVKEGGMLGYVMNGDLDGARAAVHRYIDKRRDVLRLTLMSSLEFCGKLSHMLPHPHAETYHDLDGRNFTLYHLFVPVRRESKITPLHEVKST